MDNDKLIWIIVTAVVSIVLAVFKDAIYRLFSILSISIKNKIERIKERRRIVSDSNKTIDTAIEKITAERIENSPWDVFDGLQKNVTFTSDVGVFMKRYLRKRRSVELNKAWNKLWDHSRANQSILEGDMHLIRNPKTRQEEYKKGSDFLLPLLEDVKNKIK